MSISVCAINSVGAFSDLPVLAVTDGAAVSYTISASKKGAIIMNVGDNLCWVGGATVDADAKRGVILLPRASYVFGNTKSDLKVYFQCETGDSTNIGVTEYS